MRVAVIGSGIAGLASAWLLSRAHEVTLYEAELRPGGHTHTHEVGIDGRAVAVDSGFIVHNRAHYPLFTRLLQELDVATAPTTMGFSVHEEASGLEYNAASIDGLFCRRRNLLSPRMWSMLRDLLRFYRQAPALLDEPGEGHTLADYLGLYDYGDAFRDLHLLPMACALWSAPRERILEFPARFLVRFMAQHQMLQVSGRPQWRTISGGSSRYVRAMRAGWRVRERFGCRVTALRRPADAVEVCVGAETERFDQAVLACHSDQALALLGAQATPAERAVLGAIEWQHNEAVLHTDARLLPRRRKAWAAWNAFVPRDPGQACTVSYCMNLLQGLPVETPVVVTLNRTAAIDPARILCRMRYAHPLYSHRAIAAQAHRQDIQGVRRVWFAGAWWGWGFHEDGVRSAADVASALGVPWGGRLAGDAGVSRAAA